MKISCMASRESGTFREFDNTKNIKCEAPPTWNPMNTDATKHLVDADADMKLCPYICAGKANELNSVGCCEYNDDRSCWFRKIDVLTKGGGDQRAVLCNDLYVYH